MTFQDIHMRDPFILVEEGKYYLYGSRGHELWGKCTGLDVYVSDDMETWSDPVQVFTPPADFWTEWNFWAPEVHAYQGAYYMFVTFWSETRHRGTQILKAESRMGPFVPHSNGPITPEEWDCLDGTLYVDPNGKPYMVFCHEWAQIKDGEICAVELTKDLSAAVGEPFLLFKASEPVWATGLDEEHKDCFVTDGPFMHRTKDGTLLMIWSSFTEKGYCEGIAYSDNGDITGKWRHDERLLFEEDGGHGMLFRTLEGELKFIFHQPNNAPFERPHVVAVKEAENTIYKE